MTVLTKCDHHVQYLVKSDDGDGLLCLICYVKYLQEELEQATNKTGIGIIAGDQNYI